MQPPCVITIDGPAGAGKSTLGELLARRLGYLYFDTGVMYRALTLVALEQQLDLHDPAALAALARRLVIEVTPPTVADGRQYTVLAAARDITWQLRAAEVDRNVSLIARVPAVRAELIRQQRVIAARGKVVMVGRDIGTIVMPNAALKIYLDASLDERAQRRQAELQARGRVVSLEQVRADMRRRDELDQHVLQPAADALILANDALAPDEEVDYVVRLWREYSGCDRDAGS